jgi:hypothetical protein
MTIAAPIQPGYGTGQAISSTSSAATVTIAAASKQVVLTNMGANLAYVRIGSTGLPNASAADYPVPAGAQLVVTRAETDDKLSHISPLGTTLHVMNAEGF